ncbi:fumarylacetoacetate hydrolase family protein [Paramicrobacterium fandaimingii]|uniref:fumarylacetoacetate hydrolase family protein n=1 Tax=Paramicrobacterium fandaimingii TaxID=2708079 RepID=UPI00141F20FF|nr:fumarylacetoacetate hydrolase family protein [Microbacterium fandaimingii]
MTHEVTAPKIIAVHLNYRSRAEQRGRIPAHPSYFFKPASSLSVSGETIERPIGTELLAFEGEIALIIGTDVRRVSPDEGWAAVTGVTAANDFGLYDFRAADKGSNVRSKGGDGYTPLGSEVIPADAIDPAAIRVRTWVNGALAQDDSTAGLLFPFGQIVADLSQMMTLHVGDIILTGTPAGSSVVQPGDTVEVEVDAPTAPGAPSTGRLTTTVVEGREPFTDAGEKPKATDAQREAAWGSPEAAGFTPVLTDELREKLASVGTATISSQLRKRGLNNVSIDGVTTTRPGLRMVGRARTLRYIPGREDLFQSHGGGYNAQKRIVDSLEKGDVLVMEARGETGTGTLGDVIALRAQQLGAAGVVTDGGVRDFAEVAGLDMPTFHNGAHPAVLGRRHVPWDTDITIACGGAAVQPGDIIVGDDDGVIVIPPALAAEVADAALEQEKSEVFIAEMVAAGERIEGLFPMNDEWKDRYAAWLSRR